MTGLWSSCIVLSLLVIFKFTYCTTDHNRLDEEDFITSNHVNQPAEIAGPEYSKESDNSLRDILTMASKRFDDQTFFPVRGKKEGFLSYSGVGLHTARRHKAISDLLRLIYSGRDDPVLFRFTPGDVQFPESSKGGNKRLDSFGFFGARGRRAHGWKSGRFGDQDGINTYQPDAPIKDESEEAISLKRQPPPGFYGLRG